mmetsp:Transcript_75880/g.212728  ORF Transcript_75880/g.212728 Transcript_75880/m.212728 type:complete len:104 (-) Transcript_75880:251-562(-)
MGNVSCCGLPGAGARDENNRASEEEITGGDGSNPSEAARRSPTSPQADKQADGKARRNVRIEDQQEPTSPSTTPSMQAGRKQIRKGTGMVRPEDIPFEDEDDE